MRWDILVQALFPQGHDIVTDGELLRGTGRCGDIAVTVIGSTDHVAMGVEQALAMSRDVLRTVERHPRRPILFLVDTQGQRLRRRDEMLGLNRFLAHLAQCVELARRRGHAIIGLVYDQALSGGFLASGLMADVCAALPDAEIRVMGLPAMARVTRIDEGRLRALALASPVFAPGAINYVRMGAMASLWSGDLAQHLLDAIAAASPNDDRRDLGAQRGGRLLAADIVRRVVDAQQEAAAQAVEAAH